MSAAIYPPGHCSCAGLLSISLSACRQHLLLGSGIRQRQRTLVALITRLHRFIGITRVLGTQRIELAHEHTDLLTQITDLSLQFLHVVAMPNIALLRFTVSPIKLLLQAPGHLPLAVDSDSAPGFRRL